VPRRETSHLRLGDSSDAGLLSDRMGRKPTTFTTLLDPLSALSTICAH